MRKVYLFEAGKQSATIHTVELPRNATILCGGHRNGVFVVWVEADARETTTEPRGLFFAITGHTLHPDYAWRHVNTFMIDGEFPRHLYEQLRPAPPAKDRVAEDHAKWVNTSSAGKRCRGCGAACDPVDSGWRFNGTEWEHRCPGLHPQAGHFPAGPVPGLVKVGIALDVRPPSGDRQLRNTTPSQMVAYLSGRSAEGGCDHRHATLTSCNAGWLVTVPGGLVRMFDQSDLDAAVAYFRENWDDWKEARDGKAR